MIIDFIITFLTSIAVWLLQLLPLADSSITNSVTTQWVAFKGWIATANGLFPVDTLFQILGIMLIVEAGLYAWKFKGWVAQIISAGLFKRN